MSLSRSLLSLAGRTVACSDGVVRALGGTRKPSLRVLVVHDVPPGSEGLLEAQLRYLAKSWRFITPAEFGLLMKQQAQLTDRCLLLTFDDGFASNRTVADSVLKPLHIQALFFVVPDFVDLTDRAAARRYIVERIQPGRLEDELGPGLSNMKWSDLEVLLEDGHSVGAHTKSHALLSAISDVDRLREEIGGSGDILARRLGVRIEHFAFPYGAVGSVTVPAMVEAMRRYDFVHSGIRGENRKGSTKSIRRDVMSPIEELHTVTAFVEGVADVWYWRSRNRLDALVGQALRESAS